MTEQSMRDELSALSYEHPDGHLGHLHSKAIDAILASPVFRRMQAEAWDEGQGAGVVAAINFTPLVPNPYRDEQS